MAFNDFLGVNAPAARGMSPIVIFKNKLGRYPGNNKQWWVAKAVSDDSSKGVHIGDFLPDVLDKVYSGNTKAPRGHFILNAFRKDRGAASGLGSTFPVVEKNYRPTATCFFSGRVWWAAADRVYYSQILVDDRSKAGLCFQEADPTSEDITDLIESDGGVVPITEARDIVQIVPLANGVMIFAKNGVWSISGGGTGGFSASSVALSKISAIGTSNAKSIVQVDDMIFWWSEVGIHALQQSNSSFGPIAGKFGNTSISESTIQTLYNNIPDDNKLHAKGIYDPKTNVVQWLYSSNATTATYDKVLCYDVTLQAFYPWTVAEYASVSSPKVMGAILSNNQLVSSVQDLVTTNSGAPVTNNLLDNVNVLVYTTTVADKPTNITYLTSVGTALTFSQFTNRKFIDWEAYDAVGLPYLSFMETGYEILEDAMRKKQTPYVFVHFRRTEDDVATPVSSCLFTTKWDWSANSNSNKWSRQIEAYRPKKMRLSTTADLTSGFPVVISKNKVRGSGKAIQFRFETAERGKSFDLLGWSVAYVGNTKP